MVGSLKPTLRALWFLSPVLLSCAGSTVATTDSGPVDMSANIEPDSTSSTDAPKVQHLHADYAFPVDTLEDWVTYGDAFVTFTIIKVEPIPLSKEDAELTEGVLVSSHLTAQIEEIHWTRPGASPIPSAITFTWLTSVRRDGQDRPAVTNYGQVLEAANRYVGVFSRMDSDQWQPVAAETMAGFGANGLVVVPRQALPSSGQAAIDGKSASEVGELLSRTPQYAGFSADEDLTPLERYCRVVEAGGPKGVLGLDACQVAATATTSGSSTE
jgi:hypothetical protein